MLGILCGHVHASYEVLMHGISVFGLRSTAPPYNSYFSQEDEGPWPQPHYRLVTVTDDGLSTQIFEVPL